MQSNTSKMSVSPINGIHYEHTQPIFPDGEIFEVEFATENLSQVSESPGKAEREILFSLET